MYILNKIDLRNDECIKSEPVCLNDKYTNEIYCLGMLVEREIIQGQFKGKRYYQFVYFYGKSPLNFSAEDFENLKRNYSLSMDLEMVSDFRYSYSEYKNSPGMGENFDIMQV